LLTGDDVLSVIQLNRYVQNLLAGDILLKDVWVKGEISNFKQHVSGHWYFSLKEEGAAVKCVLFRSAAKGVPFIPEDGMQVLLRGRVGLYERDGQYQLYGEEMQPLGEGSLYIALRQLKEKLAGEGLLSPKRKRPIPAFVQRLGVVTSPTGAALRDIIKVSLRRYPGIHIVVSPAQVQGDAEDSICKAIERINEYGKVDVIIVGRGGGSMEDLWAFNSEKVARTIAASKIPIISAVGHETDETLADWVADVEAPTPSAAAEMAIPDIKEVWRHVSSLKRHLVTALKHKIKRNRARVEHLSNQRILRRPELSIEQRRERVAQAELDLQRNTMQSLRGKRHEYLGLVGKLDTLSPLKVLQRGYAVAELEDGRVLQSIKQVNINDSISIIVTDGKIFARIQGSEGK